MTGELIPRITTTDLSRPARRAGRAITQYQLNGQVRIAGVDSDTDTAIAKVENMTMATVLDEVFAGDEDASLLIAEPFDAKRPQPTGVVTICERGAAQLR